MNIFKVALDTRHQNGVIGAVTQFDNAVLELQILSDGVIDEAWGQPQFELIAMKRDANPVREVDQDRFTILSKEEHRVQIELKEQFLTCRGTVKMQLVVKDGSRLSTTLFYLVIGQSLDHDIVASYRDAKVLDDLDALNQQIYDDLAFREQRYEEMEESFTELNSTMNANEAERNKAEITRQKTFDINEAHRTRTFNNQVEEQGVAFSNTQAQREKDFSESQQNMSQEFETSQRERESAFDKSQKSNQKTFETNEQKRQTTFTQSQSANQEEFDQMMEDSQQTFDATELKRQQLFNANEQVRGQNESRRVQNESERGQAETQRAAAEVTRQQKMTEFEEKATQLSNDLDTQVARVDEFVTANEKKLLGLNDKKDYMGNSYDSVKEVMDANVDWLLGEINTVHYEGQHITATDSIEGRSKSAILSGQTLVNVALTQYMTPSNNASINGETITLDLSRQWSLVEFLKDNTLLIPNEVYTCILYDVVGDTTNVNFSIQNASSTKLYLKDVGYKFKFTMGVGNDLTNRFCYIENSVATSGTVSFRLVLLKGDYTNVDIPYFEGMQSVKLPGLKACGKNLFDMNRPYDAITDNQATVVQDTNKITVSSANSGIYVNANFILDKDFFAGKTVTGSCLYESDIEDIGTVQISYQDGNGDHHYQWIKTPRTFTFPNNFIGDVMLCVSANNTGTPQSNTVTVKNIQLELGSTATSYEPHKSNILTVNEDVTLRSNGSVYDELDLLTGKLTQRIDEDGSVLTQEVVKTVDLSDNHVYSYKDVTHYDCSSAEGSLVPTLSIDVPTNLPAVVTRQRATIQALEIENAALKNEIVETANSSVSGDLELMSSQFELDFRLFEIEMNLDMPMMAMMKGAKSMAMTVYQQAKTLILAGKYDREDMEYKLGRYKDGKRITQDEYDELIALMNAHDLMI